MIFRTELGVMARLCLRSQKDTDLFPVSWTKTLCRHSECESRIRDLSWPSFSRHSRFVFFSCVRSWCEPMPGWLWFDLIGFVRHWPMHVEVTMLEMFSSCLLRNLLANFDACFLGVHGLWVQVLLACTMLGLRGQCASRKCC